MAERISTRLSAASSGKKFGLTIGAAFLVVALVAYWRGSYRGAALCAAIGAALVLAALIVPARLAAVERVWMAGAAVLSKLTTPIFMGLVYFGVFTPVGFVRRLLGKTALTRAETSGSFWLRRAEGARRSDLERQF